MISARQRSVERLLWLLLVLTGWLVVISAL